MIKLDHATKMAITHTRHCLTGCAIGEILGMVISTAFSFTNLFSIVLSIVLAFFFGYGLTFRSVYKKGVARREAVKTTLATDTVSITSMEAVDNVFILLVPGALSATLNSSLFWLSLLISLAVAFVITVPVNRFMIARGGGHAHH